MMVNDRNEMNVLGEFWNALNQGIDRPQFADIDPASLATIRDLHSIDETHAPNPTFVRRLEKQLMSVQMQAASETGELILRLSVTESYVAAVGLPKRATPTQPTRWHWHGALAALILLALVGGLVAAGRTFPTWDPDHAGLVLPALELTAEPSLTFEREITGGAVPLAQPSGMAIAEDGRIFVVDVANDTVRVFDADGKPLATWGETGDGPGKFLFSFAGWGDLAIAPDGSIVVMDPAKNEIQEFTPDGSWLRTWGGLGSEPGQFLDPTGIAIAHDGRIYVTDYTNHRVQVFDENRKFLAEWDGASGAGAPLAGPNDVAIGADGIVWVTDDILHRVFGFRPDGSVAVSFGGIGDDAGELHGPSGIAVDSGGNLFVAEHGSARIQAFAPGGTSLATFSAPGTEPGQFPKPSYIAFGPDGLLYVTDDVNHRLQEFQVEMGTS